MFASLRSRLALSNLLITLLGMTLLVGLFSRLLADRSVEIKKSERANQARAVAAQIERLFADRAGSGAPLRRTVDIASRSLGARILVVSARGQRIVDSAQDTPFSSGSWQALLDPKALQKERTVQRALRANFYEFQSPIRGTRGQVEGAVILAARVADVSPNLTALTRVILLAAAIALLIWLVIGAYFTYSISRPLLRVVAATREMARGNYAARVSARGHGEISRLATDFNGMAHQVQQSNQVLKDFLANASHDLRTPLTMIAGFSQALIDGTARPEEVQDSAAVIHQEALKMQRLVDDLLQLTRLESGLLSLDPHPTDVLPFLQAIIERVQRAYLSGNTAPIRNTTPRDLPPIAVDPERMERVVRNLLDNALQHTPPHGRINVSARSSGPHWLEISVADTGAGIPRSDVQRIFERFYRSDKSRERAHGHSGLGLAIVKEIVEAHGGQVSVTSTEGEGAIFRFTVPVAEAEDVALQRDRGTLRQAAT